MDNVRIYIGTDKVVLGWLKASNLASIPFCKLPKISFNWYGLTTWEIVVWTYAALV